MKLGNVTCSLLLFIGTMIGCKNKSTKSSEVQTSKQLIQDDTLKGFMLAGVYFIHGYGGYEKYLSKISGDITVDSTSPGFPAQLNQVYHKYFIFPFPSTLAEKADSRNTLSSWFQINDQNDFYQFLNNLKDSGFQAHYLLCKKIIDENGGVNANIQPANLKKYNMPIGGEILVQFVKDHYTEFSSAGIKSWDIAVYVYTVCLGYGAGYIDAQNGKNLIMDQLNTAKKIYKNWNTYYNDYLLGRQFSGVDQTSNAPYKNTINDMMNGAFSIYHYLPLS